jgi:T5SS/PEP-CTERM-associated repeat protein
MQAADFTIFTGQAAGISSWFDSTLWPEFLTVPSNSDSVWIDIETAYGTIDNGSAHVGSLVVACTATSVHLEVFENQTLVVGRDVVIGESEGSHGTLTLNAGSKLIIGGALKVGDSGAGTLVVKGGTVKVHGGVTIGKSSMIEVTDGGNVFAEGGLLESVSGYITSGIFSSDGSETYVSHDSTRNPTEVHGRDLQKKPPTLKPTRAPTKAPTRAPTKLPSKSPTKAPTKSPTLASTPAPTNMATKAPTRFPIAAPITPPFQLSLLHNWNFESSSMVSWTSTGGTEVVQRVYDNGRSSHVATVTGRSSVSGNEWQGIGQDVTSVLQPGVEYSVRISAKLYGSYGGIRDIFLLTLAIDDNSPDTRYEGMIWSDSLTDQWTTFESRFGPLNFVGTPTWLRVYAEGPVQGRNFAIDDAVILPYSTVSTSAPTKTPTQPPTLPSTSAPTKTPTLSPTLPSTSAPTKTPTNSPTLPSTSASTEIPTKSPTLPSTSAPTKSPTLTPTLTPTNVPTRAPTRFPTLAPTPPAPAPTTPPLQSSILPNWNFEDSSIAPWGSSGGGTVAVQRMYDSGRSSYVAVVTGRSSGSWQGIGLSATSILQAGEDYIVRISAKLYGSYSGIRERLQVTLAIEDDSPETTRYEGMLYTEDLTDQWNTFESRFGPLNIVGTVTSIWLYVEGPEQGRNFAVDNFVILPDLSTASPTATPTPQATTPDYIVGSTMNTAMVTLRHPPQASFSSNNARSNCPHIGGTYVNWHSQYGGLSTGQNVTLPSNTAVLVTRSISQKLGFVTIPRTSSLIFGENSTAAINMDVKGIKVEGSLIAGSKTCRLQTKLTITLHGSRPTVSKDPVYKGIDVTGVLSLHGKRFFRTWTR